MYLKVLIPERRNTVNPMMLASKVLEELKIGDEVIFDYSEITVLQENKHPGLWVFNGYVECPVNCNNAFCKGKMQFTKILKYDVPFSFTACVLYYIRGAFQCPLSFICKLDDSLFEI